MKKFYLLAVFIAVIAAISLTVYGCGGLAAVVTSAATSGGLTLLAATSTVAVRSVDFKGNNIKGPGEFDDYSYMHCNPYYLDKLQIPSSYVVGLAEMKFLTQNLYNDPAAYSCNLEESQGSPVSITSPLVVDMTNGTFTVLNNVGLPTAGVYTYQGVCLVYIQQEVTGCFSTTDISSISTGKFRVYASTSGNVQAGDILFYANDTWNWINPTTFTLTPYTSSRPGGTASGWDSPSVEGIPTAMPTKAAGVEVMQDQFWSLRPAPANTLMPWQAAIVATFVANNYQFKQANQLPTPITIVAGHSYTGTVTFNLAATGDAYFTGGNAIPGQTGTFFWDDVTPDGIFAPFLSRAHGGDADGENGPPTFSPLPPTVTPTITQTN